MSSTSPSGVSEPVSADPSVAAGTGRGPHGAVPDAGAERRVRARIATELAVAQSRVDAAVDLLDGGATVPFVARYR